MPSIIFRGKTEPLQVTKLVADAVREAKKNGDNEFFETDSLSFETKDVKFVDYGQQAVPAQSYPCHNSCGEDYHNNGDVCPKSYTGNCVTCGKAMWERDREYALSVWGKVLCREHSPLGEVERHVGIATDPTGLKINGFITSLMSQGETIEEAVAKAHKQFGG